MEGTTTCNQAAAETTHIHKTLNTRKIQATCQVYIHTGVVYRTHVHTYQSVLFAAALRRKENPLHRRSRSVVSNLSVPVGLLESLLDLLDGDLEDALAPPAVPFRLLSCFSFGSDRSGAHGVGRDAETHAGRRGGTGVVGTNAFHVCLCAYTGSTRTRADTLR